MKYLTTLATSGVYVVYEDEINQRYPHDIYYSASCDIYTDSDTQTKLYIEYSCNDEELQQYGRYITLGIDAILQNGYHEYLGAMYDADDEISLIHPLSGNVTFTLEISPDSLETIITDTEIITFTRPNTYEYISTMYSYVTIDNKSSGRLYCEIYAHTSRKYFWYEFYTQGCSYTSSSGVNLMLKPMLSYLHNCGGDGGGAAHNIPSLFNNDERVVSTIGSSISMTGEVTYWLECNTYDEMGESHGGAYQKVSIFMPLPAGNVTLFIKNGNEWLQGIDMFIKDSNSNWRQAETIQQNA